MAVHPHADRVAVVNGETGIDIIAVKDGRRTTLALVNFGGSFLKWSPDGEKLAYMAVTASERRALHVVNVGDSRDRRVTRLTEDVDTFNWRPSVQED